MHGDGESGSLHEVYECPVCFDPIQTSNAAMRCTGEGGQCHYFHAHCLAQWIQTMRHSGTSPTCPCCRGAVEIHTRRLEEFLSSSADGGAGESKEGYVSGAMSGRKELEDLLARIQSLPGSIVDGWNNLTQLEVTTEQIVEGASIAAGAGWGFYAGSRGHWGVSTGSWGLDRIMWENSSNTAKAATVLGFVVGAGYRWWTQEDARLKEEEEQRRRRRQQRR